MCYHLSHYHSPTRVFNFNLARHAKVSKGRLMIGVSGQKGGFPCTRVRITRLDKKSYPLGASKYQVGWTMKAYKCYHPRGPEFDTSHATLPLGPMHPISTNHHFLLALGQGGADANANPDHKILTHGRCYSSCSLTLQLYQWISCSSGLSQCFKRFKRN